MNSPAKSLSDHSAYVLVTANEEWRYLDSFRTLILSRSVARSPRARQSRLSSAIVRLRSDARARVLVCANAVAVLETSDCRGRKFLRGRPPRVMHIHEYSNVIERRSGGGRRQRGPRVLRSAVDSIQEWRGPTVRVYIDKRGPSRTARSSWRTPSQNTETAVHFMRAPRRHARHRFLSRERYCKKCDASAMMASPKRYCVMIEFNFDTDQWISFVKISLLVSISDMFNHPTSDAKIYRKFGTLYSS